MPRRSQSDGRKIDEKSQLRTSTEIDSPNPSPPAIFKLNPDCLEEIFDYLTLQDLYVMCRTCKRFNLIAGNYFRQTYAALEFRSKRDGIYTTYRHTSVKFSGFDRFIESLVIRGFLYSSFESGLKRFQYISANCNKFLQQIRFENVQLTGREIECIREIMANVVCVAIENCRLKRKFYERFPEMCANLRKLSVNRFQCNQNVLKRTGNEWLLRNWPKLEHLRWTQVTNGCRINELKMFFELNPTIRRFSTNYSCLWMSRCLIFDSSVKLNDLIVEFDRTALPNINFIYNLLNELHQNGVYKRLHLEITYFNQRFIDEMIDLRGLEGLTLGNLEETVDLSPLVNLKILKIANESSINARNFKVMAEKLKNLEEIYLKQADFREFLPFIQQSVKLKRMKIDLVRSKDFNGILDLNNLNKQREQLEKARKIMIYIDEKVYLATKWTEKKTEFNLIEIRRTDQAQWGWKW